jgi:hypothetical protein
MGGGKRMVARLEQVTGLPLEDKLHLDAFNPVRDDGRIGTPAEPRTHARTHARTLLSVSQADGLLTRNHRCVCVWGGGGGTVCMPLDRRLRRYSWRGCWRSRRSPCGCWWVPIPIFKHTSPHPQ